MLRKNMIRILAIAAFCSLPYNFVANIGTASAVELQDKVQSNLKLSASGNASFTNRYDSSFIQIAYNYAVYTGDNSALIALTATLPTDYYWIDEDYKLDSNNDPFATFLSSNNWKSKRYEKLTSNQLVIFEYRELDTNQDNSSLETNANKNINMINYPIGLSNKAKGQRLNDTQLSNYLPKIAQHIYQ